MRFLTGRTWFDDPQPGPEGTGRGMQGLAQDGARGPTHGPPPAYAQEIWKERRKLTKSTYETFGRQDNNETRTFGSFAPFCQALEVEVV